MLAARDRHGFLQAETMVSMTVLGVLAICIAVTAHSVQRVHRVLLLKQRCIAAAQAQIESIVARDQPIGPDKVAMLWPGLDVQTQVILGEGQWQGLELVKATASVQSGRRVVQVTLARYRPKGDKADDR